MGLIITPQEQIDAYYASDDLSQSKLKKLLTGLDAFTAEQEDLSKKSFIIQGKAVDTILTGEEGDFEKNFYVSTSEKKPSAAIANIVEHVFSRVSEDYEEYLSTIVPLGGTQEVVEGQTVELIEHDNLEEEVSISPFSEFVDRLDLYDTYIIEGCENYVNPETKAVGYQPRYGADAKLKAVCEQGSSYFVDLCNSYGKTIIDAITYSTIMSIVDSLRTNLRTASFFDRDEQRDFTHVNVYLQLPIYFAYRGFQCKALLDLVIVVTNTDGEILLVSPYDLKTMNGNTYNFLNSIKSYRYDIQGVWYTLAVMDSFNIGRDKVGAFKFIVESTSRQGKPLVYELSEAFLQIGKKGREGYYSPAGHLLSPPIKGLDQLIDMIEYHEENGWEAEKEIQQADLFGKPLLVDWEGIVEYDPFENVISEPIKEEVKVPVFEFKEELLSQEEMEASKDKTIQDPTKDL